MEPYNYKAIKITKSNYKEKVKNWKNGKNTNKMLVYCPDDREDYVVYNNVFKYAFNTGVLVRFENIQGTPYGQIEFLCKLED